MKKARIGVTLDSRDVGDYSSFPWYALRQNYCDAIADVGGIPVPLPHFPNLAEEYLIGIDGLVITGGAFDVDPALYGQNILSNTVTLNNRRTEFELALLRKALQRNLPILGICGGEQLLAVAMGGTLIQHIPDVIENPLAHEQPNPRNEASHQVTIKAGTLLASLAHNQTIEVNSAHHQAVATLPDDLVVNALATDGVIEGIEAPAMRFCLGIQWHPEFSINPTDRAIFTGLIDACLIC